MSIEGQGHFLTLFFQVLYTLCLYEAQISGERLQSVNIGPLVQNHTCNAQDAFEHSD